MKNKIFPFSSYFFPWIIALVIVPLPAFAVILPPCATDSGSCTVCDLILFFINIATTLLSYISAVAILMFIVGGFMWILSGGNSERIQKGRMMMVGALIGVVLALTSFTIINVLIASFVGATDFRNVKIFQNQNWYEYCPGATVPTPASGPIFTN